MEELMSTTERAKALESVLTATTNEDPMVKQAAINVLAATVSDPRKTADAVRKVLDATKGETATVKRDAVAAVESREQVIPPPTDVTGLWWALVIGLLALLLITLFGLLWTILDGDNKTSADKVLIVFTPLLTGLLGLFAPSPRQTSGTNTSGG
jgi:hypothetical protein